MNLFFSLFTSLNIAVYRLTNGRIGSKLGKQSILLLNTTGRKSGKKYITTLAYYHDGNNYLVVGSNWGKEEQPGWFYNLTQNPRTTIQVGRKVLEVDAHPAKGDDYQRLWQLVTRQYHQLVKYQRGIKRQIPIIILTPNNPSETN